MMHAHSLHPLLSLSATKLARMIRLREVSSTEVVQVHIDHIRKVNPVIRAMVRDRFDDALREAEHADARVRNEAPDSLPPLLGVPCTIKEAFAVCGMPNTAGLVSRVGVRPSSDATAVARIRAAGAIALGVTNISELCMYMESDNRVYGRTNNPYDPTRIAGGSSGGEGAVIGAGGSPFGLGSDIGGSIRMPSFFNGIFGHKPTGGLVPGSGQFPISSGPALRYLTTGPMARRAEDLATLLRLLAGPDGIDAGCQLMRVETVEQLDLTKLRVLDMPDNGVIAVSEDLRDAQRRCAEALAARGARVRRQSIPALKRSFAIWSAMLSAAGGQSFAELMGGGVPIGCVRELLRWTAGRSKHTFPAIGLAVLEKVPKLFRSRARELLEAGASLREELVEAIGPNGVMLYPPYASPAPKHYVSMIPPFKWVYTAILNVMELPATQVPLGLNSRGLPLGVQVVGIHGNDALTLAVAVELERIFGGWVPPSFDARAYRRAAAQLEHPSNPNAHEINLAR